MKRNSDIFVRIDTNAVLRGAACGFATGFGKTFGRKLVDAADIHAEEGDKVALAVGIFSIIGSGVLAAFGQHILTEVVPNNPVAEEETDAE